MQSLPQHHSYATKIARCRKTLQHNNDTYGRCEQCVANPIGKNHPHRGMPSLQGRAIHTGGFLEREGIKKGQLTKLAEKLTTQNTLEQIVDPLGQ